MEKIYRVQMNSKGMPNFATAEEIIRCGECNEWNEYARDELGRCDCHLITTRTDDFCSYGSSSEKPNNCEHITEDGVTCAKYPACDDCIDNPLNKVKGSERFVKGSEQTERSSE